LFFINRQIIIKLQPLTSSQCYTYIIMSNFFISSTVRHYPKLSYEKIKTDILGSDYNLSLTFVGSQRAKTLNQKYRKASYVPNVLSFPLDEKHGEIFITPTVASSEAKKFSMTKDGYIGFLFIHGCLHLKGHGHGVTMEEAEAKYCKKYGLK